MDVSETMANKDFRIVKIVVNSTQRSRTRDLAHQRIDAR